MPLSFSGTTALITGASRGIGAALTAAFAARGADLVLTARDRAALEQAAAPFRQAGRRIDILPEDLSDPAAPARLVAELEARGLVVDHLVNNDGISTVGLAHNLYPESQRAVLQVNAVTPVELGIRLLPGMVARRRGGILNVASTSAFQAMPWVTAYAATKALLLSWSQGVHAELRGTGVRCNVVCPGPVDTELLGQGKTEEQKQAFARMAALGRLGQPGDIAAAVALLAGESARWVTGQNVRANGGLI